MFLKPKPGLVVRDPVTKFPLPAEGRDVQMTSYWQRRLDSGDVEVPPPPAAPAPTQEPEDPTLEDSYHSDSDEVKP